MSKTVGSRNIEIIIIIINTQLQFRTDLNHETISYLKRFWCYRSLEVSKTEIPYQMLGEVGNLVVSSMKYEKPLRETVAQYRIGIRKYAAVYVPCTVQSTVNLLLRPKSKMQTAKGT